VLCSVPFLAAAFPELVHFGSRCWTDYSPREREQLMPLLKAMMGWMSLLASLFFTMDIHWQIRNALSGSPGPPSLWLPAGLIFGEGASIIYYLHRFDEKVQRN